VRGAPGPSARAAFVDAYGPVDDRALARQQGGLIERRRS
jgi:hypothetical protein